MKENKEKEIQEKVRQAYTHATPDILDAVRTDCADPAGKVVPLPEGKRKNPWVKRLVAAAAAFVVLAGATAGYLTYRGSHTVASTVSLDVNPSIEIQVNKQERVLSAIARNEDGRRVIGDMDFTGSSLDVTINAIIGSMLKEGYLSELANSILVSVDNEDPAEAEALQKKLTEEIHSLLQTNTFDGAVLSQTVSADAELENLADTYGITVGKAKLIQQITQQNPLYTFETLAPLSINELNLLSASGSAGLEAVESIGTASDKAYIGTEKAKGIALEHAGVTAAAATGLRAEMDYENGTMVYEVEFKAGGYEYDYEVNATSGAIVHSERELDDDAQSRPTQSGTTTGSGSSAAATTSAGTTTNTSATYIGEAKAKEIALARAGVAAGDIREYKMELERENGRMVYDIEFDAGGYEYQYKVDATSGTIVHEDRERDDDAQNRPTGTTTAGTAAGPIGEAKAKEIVLARAGVAAGDVREYEIELDRDDGRKVYEIEFKAGGYEYQYEVDASTGDIIKQEKERDD